MLSAVLLAAAGCSTGGDDADDRSASPTAAPTAAPSRSGLPVATPLAPRPTERPALRIVLTNDDGVGAGGIDAMARALRRLPEVELRIVAPATDQSGTGSATTLGGASRTAARTASGLRATAVRGYPADTIEVALDDLGLRPHLVVSGVNRGVNAGSAVPISGTVGAARAAISRGVPAVAASAAVAPGGGTPDWSPATDYVTSWVTDHRADLLAGAVATRTLVNVNTPWCRGRAVRRALAVTVATGDVRPGRISACGSDVPRPRTDVGALDNGYVAVTRVRATLATPYPR